MIARLQGTVIHKGVDHAVIDVGGVGYRVYASVGTLSSLPPAGGEAVLRIHTHVAEGALDLYGFATEMEEQVFRALIDTPSIGCRKASQILSGIPADEIVDAIRKGDAVRLSKAHGVGKKTAERLVVEMKDRMLRIAVTAAAAGGGRGTPAPSGGIVDDLVGGLVNLGYKADAARRAAEIVLDESPEADLPALLRTALQRLRKT